MFCIISKFGKNFYLVLKEILSRKVDNYKMDLQDKLTSIVVWIIFTLFNIYSRIATVVLWIFFPITKYLVDRKFKSFGVTIDGPLPTDPQFNEETKKKVYIRMAIEGTLGFFESHMDKEWTVKDFAGLISIIMLTRRQPELSHPLTWMLRTFNFQTKERAWEVGKQHYDVGNDIIESMLDKNLQYTCGYWKEAKDLDEAQIAKMELIAQKLRLKPGMKVLDIGCGYGTLGHYLATNYGVQFVGCSVSEEQIKFAREHCRGLPCQFLLCDYRDIDDTFDRIVSVGMFEHVGGRNYKTFFEVCHKCLKDDGILLLHTIGNLHKKLVSVDAWVHKYIFRNGYVPYYMEMCKAMEDLWILEDWHNFGFDYSKTLKAWENNFDKAWPKFESTYGEKFHILWKMYLQSARVMFETRSLHLWQLVLTKDGLKGGYHAPR